MKYKLKLLFFFLLLPAIAVAQEELKSDVEDYYDFLSLSGTVERPYLNFRTLSDSDWKVNENTNHVWKGINLAGRHPITKKNGIQGVRANFFSICKYYCSLRPKRRCSLARKRGESEFNIRSTF